MIGSALHGRARIGLAALALGLALGGCDDLRKMTGMDSPSPATNTVTPTTNTATGTGPSLSAPQTGSTANPQLAQQIAAAASSSTRPPDARRRDHHAHRGPRQRHRHHVRNGGQPGDPAGPVDLLRMTAQTSNQTNLCANINAANLIRMGATMSHHYTDPNGTRFQTSVVSCPG